MYGQAPDDLIESGSRHASGVSRCVRGGGRRSRRNKRTRRGLGKRSDRGLAVVELAICLPILVLLLLATVEACVMLQLKQNVTITAYEGARIGILPGAEAPNVQTQCEMLLDDREIDGYTITMNPDPSAVSTGDMFSVTVSADCVANSVLGGVFYQGNSISETVIMRAE